MEPTEEPSDCQLECGNNSLGLNPVNCTCLCADGLTSCIQNIDLDNPSVGRFLKARSGSVGSCPDLSGNNRNCGAYGVVCTGALPEVQENVRAAGTCTVACARGLVTCSPDAVCKTFLDRDNAHCGSCGSCGGATPTCVDSVCACNVECTGGAVINADCTECVCAAGIDNDSQNCGSCGNVCPPFASVCNNGACIVEATGA